MSLPRLRPIAPRPRSTATCVRAESGWDFSSRWLADGSTLATIRTIDIVPPDLNSLLYHLERTLADAYRDSNQTDKAKEFTQRAGARRAAMHRHLWDGELGVFADHLWREDRSTGHVTAATLYPLYFDVADRSQATRVARRVRADLLQPHGLATTTRRTDQQWDAPNGWAPLQWIAVRGLQRHGQGSLADEIAERWIRHNVAVFRKRASWWSNTTSPKPPVSPAAANIRCRTGSAGPTKCCGGCWRCIRRHWPTRPRVEIP